MPALKVAIVGATGNTGASVVDGLLASETHFEITALSRESSLNNAANQSLRARGVRVVPIDLTGPQQSLVDTLTGIDIVISCIVAFSLQQQIPLAEAAKKAGVKRFVPCNFGTPAPRGIMWLDDQKYEILDAIQRIYLPYTVIDVGWWSEQITPVLPSGKTNHALLENESTRLIPGDGNVPVAFTSISDIGIYVAKIIADPRTINKKVLAFTDVLTMNQAYDIMDELSGEKSIRQYRSAEALEGLLAESREALDRDPQDRNAFIAKLIGEYHYSWGVRGDNQPKSAEYLGYLNFKELYPEASGRTLKTVFTDLLDGKTPQLHY